MNRDEAMQRILRLVSSDAVVESIKEAESAPAPVVEKPRGSRRRTRRRPSTWRTQDGSELRTLLEKFTPESAFQFICDRTLPPATEDGLALIEAYPELSFAAPELVADIAVAFRHKTRSQYAAYFALVAKHYGLELAP